MTPNEPDASRPYWFRARGYGWGWTPATWQGWAVTGLYTAGLIGWLLYVFMDRQIDVGLHLDFAPVLPILVLTAVLIAICRWKGEPPHWKWGR